LQSVCVKSLKIFEGKISLDGLTYSVFDNVKQ